MREHPTPWIFGRISIDFYLPKDALGSDEAADRLEGQIDELIRDKLSDYRATIERGSSFVSIEYGRDMGSPAVFS